MVLTNQLSLYFITLLIMPLKGLIGAIPIISRVISTVRNG